MQFAKGDPEASETVMSGAIGPGAWFRRCLGTALPRLS